jgi:Flp pilus assembly protein TadG
MTDQPRHARREDPEDRERGSITVWMAITSVVLIVMMGFALDGGAQIRAKERAQDLAVEAARAGAQQLAGSPAVQGQGVNVDPGAAIGAASTYLAGIGDVTGTAQVVGNRVVVDTSTTVPTTFLSMIGINTMTVHGHAEVATTRTVGGVAR